MKKSKFAYVLILPCLIFLVLFRLIPILESASLSIFNLEQGKSVFNNLINYKEIFKDKLLILSIKNSLIIFLVHCLLNIPLLVIFGIIIHSLKKAQKHYSRIIFIPTLVGLFAYGIIFRLLFSSGGMVNNFLGLVGLSPDWFEIEILSQSVVVFAILWSSFGVYLLMVINAISSVPKVYFEMLNIEGATFIQSTFYVVIPSIKSVLKTITFLAFVQCLTIVDIPMNMTQGAPNGATITLGYYVYKQAFSYGDFSYASTIGIVILIAFILVFFLKKLRRNKNEDNY